MLTPAIDSGVMMAVRSFLLFDNSIRRATVPTVPALHRIQFNDSFPCRPAHVPHQNRNHGSEADLQNGRHGIPSPARQSNGHPGKCGPRTVGAEIAQADCRWPEAVSAHAKRPDDCLPSGLQRCRPFGQRSRLPCRIHRKRNHRLPGGNDSRFAQRLAKIMPAPKKAGIFFALSQSYMIYSFVAVHNKTGLWLAALAIYSFVVVANLISWHETCYAGAFR